LARELVEGKDVPIFARLLKQLDDARLLEVVEQLRAASRNEAKRDEKT
jgi:hypothetical protein